MLTFRLWALVAVVIVKGAREKVRWCSLKCKQFQIWKRSREMDGSNKHRAAVWAPSESQSQHRLTLTYTIYFVITYVTAITFSNQATIFLNLTETGFVSKPSKLWPFHKVIQLTMKVQQEFVHQTPCILSIYYVVLGVSGARPIQSFM